METRSSSQLILVGSLCGRQFVAHDLDEIVAGKQLSCLTVGEALLGQKHQRDHDQSHVVMPGMKAPDLVVGHTAGALGVLEALAERRAGITGAGSDK